MHKNSSDKIFYIYLDYTLEEVPRVFYVGKGQEQRIAVKERNIYWKRIANKYGQRREVLFGSKANTGKPSHFKGKKHTEETKEKLSLSHKGLSAGEKNPKAKLNEQDVVIIREKYLTKLYSLTTLAVEYNVSPTTIINIVKRQTWKHIK